MSEEYFDIFKWVNEKGELKKKWREMDSQFKRGYEVAINEIFDKLEEEKKKDKILSEIFINKEISKEIKYLKRIIQEQKKIIYSSMNILRELMLKKDENKKSKDLQDIFQDFCKFMSKHGFNHKLNLKESQKAGEEK